MRHRFSRSLAACAAAWAAGALAQAGGTTTEGELVAGDETLESGEYADRHTFFGRPGQRVTVDLTSEEFDPYLLVVAPDEEQIDNDDFEGDQTHSRVSMAVAEQGTHEVYVTSFEPGEVGRYTLVVSIEDVAPLLSQREESGTLAAGDETLNTGEYFDTYEFVGAPGQHVRIDVRSSDFDTYVILVPPKGEQQENDDGESTSHSSIDTELTERGNFRVLVTSYEPGESGDYVLTIGEVDTSTLEEPLDVAAMIAPGERVEGTLESGDHELSGGEYSDAFEFEGVAGDAVRIELSSTAFDTYLALITPGEESIQNDDYEGDTGRSVIELPLSESGRYRIVATSYEAGETGAYSLELAAVDVGSLITEEEPAGRIYGLFAGIGDYPGKDNDLVFTADDAVRLRDALINGAGMLETDQITLVDSEVTREALGAALRDLGRRARPEDKLVFFFSGHGDRIASPTGPSATDPDALDETLELYDGSLTDDELRELFADVDAGTVLIFIDSCFSGGFAKDLISVPGRMGMFSSEEDVVSSVAAKFRAGGYLSAFLADGIAEKLADADRDGTISAIELSQYVYERYRADVKTSADGFARTDSAQTAHQHLVVDRGSIGPYDALFR